MFKFHENIGISYSSIFLGQFYLNWLIFIRFCPSVKNSFRFKFQYFSTPVMVLTNIISQTQYIFPHIFLLHFNVSFNTISLLWLWKDQVKNNRSITERSQHHILSILRSPLLVCFFEGVLLSPVLLLLNTQKFWQIWATLYKYYTSFSNSEFPKATERSGI